MYGGRAERATRSGVGRRTRSTPGAARLMLPPGTAAVPEVRLRAALRPAKRIPDFPSEGTQMGAERFRVPDPPPNGTAMGGSGGVGGRSASGEHAGAPVSLRVNMSRDWDIWLAGKLGQHGMGGEEFATLPPVGDAPTTLDPNELFTFESQ